MFKETTTTTIKYYLTKQNFKEVRKIFCTWTNTDYESIKNDLTADELFKMRSKFFQAVTNHLAETQKTLDNIIQDKDDELTKRVIKSLIDKIHSDNLPEPAPISNILDLLIRLKSSIFSKSNKDINLSEVMF